MLYTYDVKEIMYGLGLALVLLLVTAVAEILPHTRFNHLNEDCVYYDGVKQCRLKHEFCNPEGTDRPAELGLCANLGADVLAEPLEDTIQPSGTCPIEVTEGELVKINWVSQDPDDDIGPQGFLSYTYEGVLGEDGTWQTKIGDAGIHQAKAKVFDGEFTDETSLCIKVLSGNKDPQLDVRDSFTVHEGDTLNLNAKCWDPDGDEVKLTISGWMTAQTREIKFNEDGDYTVLVECEDTNGAKVDKNVAIKVENLNRPPTIEWERA